MHATRPLYWRALALALVLAAAGCGNSSRPVQLRAAATMATTTTAAPTTTTQAPPPPTTTPPRPPAKVARTGHRAQVAGAGATGPCDRPSTCPQLRQCEHGGSYTAGSNPRYKFAYQFSRTTWISLGAQTKEGIAASAAAWDAGTASPAEQDARADALYYRSGRGQWPICGRFLR